MGGGGKGKGKKRKRAKRGEDDEPASKRGPARNDTWQEESGSHWELKNEDYEAYYARQRVCSEEEFPLLLQALRTGLPVAIRVNRMRTGAPSLCSRLEEMQKLCASDSTREAYAPRSLTWYPHSLGWQWSGLERRTIKKDKNNQALKDFLATRERSGLLSRQETVSMVPPLFLDVKPHHLVLDMCAAPGSKTSQILEIMHWPNCADGADAPTGLVVANELQWKRSNMLAHQVQRLGSSCAAVVNMDAQFFPELWVPSEDGNREEMRFDRVLCDVPCSGDGTMRKTPYIWKSWTLRDGLSLHIRQLGILNRGLDLLRVGGRLVYSTCSLNPVEDEAVVAAALQRNAGAVALAAPPELPGFKAAVGLKKWVIPDPNGSGAFYDDYSSVPQELKECKHKLLPSMFAPSDSDEIMNEVQSHCRRLLPHLMDTGGFFVAIFEKKAEMKPSSRSRRDERREQMQARKTQQVAAAKEKSEVEETGQLGDVSATAESSAPDATERSLPQGGEEVDERVPEQVDTGTAESSTAPVATPDQAVVVESRAAPANLRNITKDYVQIKEAIWNEIADFYGLDRDLGLRFVMRSEGEKHPKVFLISPGLERLLRATVKMPTRMVLCGVAAFEVASSYHENACQWRPIQQGLQALVALGMRRRLTASRSLLVKLLKEKELTLKEVNEAVASGQLEGLEALRDPVNKESLRPGSLAIVLRSGDAETSTNVAPFVIGATISDDILASAVHNAVELSALLEDLEGQPLAEDILQAPSENIEAEESDGNDADLEPVDEDHDDAS